jgi:cytoskeletal protein CcmA (bactofilin family)
MNGFRITMVTRIGKGVHITGSLTAEEPVFIRGRLKGEIIVGDHAVMIEEGGQVEGTITARVITIEGSLHGRLIARDVVRLLEGSMVRGDVVTPRLGIDDGARFKGKVDGGTRAEAAARVAAYRQTVPGEPAIRR